MSNRAGMPRGLGVDPQAESRHIPGWDWANSSRDAMTPSIRLFTGRTSVVFYVCQVLAHGVYHADFNTLIMGPAS